MIIRVAASFAASVVAAVVLLGATASMLPMA